VCETPPGIREVELFQETAITEVKEWVTKCSVPKRETPQRTDAKSAMPPDSPLGII
jgi:hypothetical protein